MSVDVTTRSYDSQNTGWNSACTTFTPSSVKANGLTIRQVLDLGPDARGSEGQPLLMHGLVMPDGIAHDCVFSCTMYNDVICKDLHSGDTLWSQHVGVPIHGTLAMDMYLINDFWGILSTPVIDVVLSGVLYCCAMTSATADYADSHYVVHCLRLTDGAAAKLPLDLAGAQYVVGTTTATMKTVPRKQRCGLTLAGDFLFVANGSFDEDADTNQGWLIAVDVSQPTLTINATFCSTMPPRSGGGFWMGAQKPAIDPASGDVLLTVGNGDFDAENNWGETVLRISHAPDVGASGYAGSLAVAQWFTPYTDTGRQGNAATQTLATMPDGDDPAAPGGTSNMDSPSDEDLNSGGTLLILKSISKLPWDIGVVAGKDGIGYFIDLAQMGSPTLADFAPATIVQKVDDALLCPPYGLTAYFGDENLEPTVLNTLATTYGGFTHHLHGTCLFYPSDRLGPMLYCWGENGNLRAFQLSAPQGAAGKLTVQYMACSAAVASPDCANNPPGGMPGGMITGSSNGGVDGLIWAAIPYGNANNSITNGRFMVFDAENFVDGIIQPVFDSQDWAWSYKHNKFNQITVSDVVLLPTYQAQTWVLS